MTNEPLTEELKAYIDAFEKNARENFENGRSKIYVLIRNTCAVCHRQLEGYQKMGFTIDGTVNDMDILASYIYLVDIGTKLGMMLISESRAWKRELKNPDLEIKYTPTYIDAKTHQIIVIGAQEKDTVLDMLDDEIIAQRRSGFAEMVNSKGKKNCDAVACGLDEQVTAEKSKTAMQADREKKENA